MRCDEFYEKWKRCGNFCEKNEHTARQIYRYLEEIEKLQAYQVKREKNAVKKGSVAIGTKDDITVSENAMRPVLTVSDPEVKERVYEKILDKAEEKVKKGEEPIIRTQEMEDIVKAAKTEKTVIKAIEHSPEKAKFNETNDNIEWAKWTWNPVTGCKHGCKYCYARDIATRFTEGFEPTFRPERLEAPRNMGEIELKSPGDKGVFVCSMADLFGEWVPQEWIDAVLESIRKSPEWNFIFLTKNPARLTTIDFPANAWVGATVDIQARVKPACDALSKVKAKVRFVSCEPMMEELHFESMNMIDWIIIGGRSETTGMPAGQPEWNWVEYLLKQAREFSVRVYFKPNLTVRPREYPGRQEF